MNRLFKMVALCIVLFLVASPVLAQEAGAEDAASSNVQFHLGTFAVPFGAALIIMGAAYGIGKIGSAAVESMARQPEVASSVQTAMIIAAALIEGATFFALIVCMLATTA